MAIAAGISLSWLLAPVSPEQFYRDVWERCHLAVHRSSAGYYSDLLSISDIDSMLAGSAGVSPRIRIVNHGKELSPEALPVPWMHNGAGRTEAIYQEYREGATLVFPFIHDQWKPLGQLCSSLSAECSASFQVNAYLTPRNSQGLNPHYDTHDVFVLQVAGSKYWQLYEGGAVLPLKEQPFDSKSSSVGPLIEEVDLAAGDLLYIPRGRIHVASSGDETSLHLTLGVNTVTWASVLNRAVEMLINEDPAWRESLPPAFASDASFTQIGLSELASRLGDLRHHPILTEVLVDAIEAARLGAGEQLAGHLLDLEDSSGVGLDTPFRLRDLPCELLREPPGSVSVQFLGKAVSFPEHIESELQFMLDARSFTAREFPGSLDADGRNVLVTTLLREGLLTIDDGARASSR